MYFIVLHWGNKKLGTLLSSKITVNIFDRLRLCGL